MAMGEGGVSLGSPDPLEPPSQYVRENQRQRLLSETADEREARNQHQRLLSETADEKEARVESLRANQNRRLSSDDRQARLQRMKE